MLFRASRAYLVAVAVAVSHPAAAERLRDTLATPAGTLTIRQLDEGDLGDDFAVTLGGRMVMRSTLGDAHTRFPDFPVPGLLQYIDRPLPPFTAVAVFQQNNWGNACDGGPIWLLGIYADGRFRISEPIDFCGGPPPVVHVEGTAVQIDIPASRDAQGAVTVPAEAWVFANGKLRRVR